MNKMAAFVVGGAVGAAVGAAVSAVLTPKRGDAFQADVRATLQEARSAGQIAEMEAREQFRQRYRESVGDPNALDDRS